MIPAPAASAPPLAVHASCRPRSPTNLTGGDFCFRLRMCERCFASEVAVGGACIQANKEMVVNFVERNVQRFRGVRRARVSGNLVLQTAS